MKFLRGASVDLEPALLQRSIVELSLSDSKASREGVGTVVSVDCSSCGVIPSKCHRWIRNMPHAKRYSNFSVVIVIVTDIH